jgi:hypothetical protein
MSNTGETGVVYPAGPDGKTNAGSTVVAQALMAASIATVDSVQAEAIVAGESESVFA